MIGKVLTRKQEKIREARRERQAIQTVRPKVVGRDGYCRLQGVQTMGPCLGPSEWAHLPSHRRSKTRGQAPEARHTTAGSLMLCAGHHDALDEHRMWVKETTERGADGPLLWSRDDVVYKELEH